jgi:hypothetical protein
MPQSNSSRRLLLRLVLFTFAGWVLWALGRNGTKPVAGDPTVVLTAEPDSEPTRMRVKTGGFSKRRLATSLAFTTLFFAGAAFSAGAGGVVGPLLEGSCDAEATSTEATSADSCDAAAAEESSDPAAAEDQSSEETTPSDDASEPAPDPALSGDEQSGEPADGSGEQAGDPADQAGESGDQAGGEPADDQSGEPADGSGSDGSDEPASDPAPGGDNASGGEDEWSDEPADDQPEAGPGSPAHAGDGQAADGGSQQVGLTSSDDAARDLEFDGAGYGIVWLHRTLPDPTPPASRLAPDFAQALLRESRANHVDWALVLGVLRASGHRASRPASPGSLDQLASRLAELKANTDEWRAALALGGRTSFADRAIALTRYNRAVGLRALVRGLLADQSVLEQRVLSDSRLDIYAGGRDDVANHRINVRVLALMLYMAECHGQVTVSSLNSGHRLFSRPGVVSAHKYGLAVDLAALGGESILGHQQAGGLTERAVRNILLLPVEVKPKQVISLLGLGGPSFPLADHYDHIHVGY